MKPKVFIGTIELIISMVKILFYIVNYQKIFFRGGYRLPKAS